MPEIARFNRISRWIASLWLLTALPLSFLVRPTYQDFQAFYSAGITMRLGEWEALYPERDLSSPYFIYSGFHWKPRQLELAKTHGYDAVEPFLQPPWTAVAFVPLAMLPYPLAHAIWVGILISCAIALVWMAGEIASICSSNPTRWVGGIMLISAFSPLLYRGVRVGNVSVIVAAAMGYSALSLCRRRPLGAAAGMVVGGSLKYATAALGPLLLAMRQWRTLLTLLLAGTGIVLATTAWSGTAPLSDFFHTVAATFPGSTPLRQNQSIWGLLLRLSGSAPLAASVVWIVRAVQVGLLALLIFPMFRSFPREGNASPKIFAASAGLVAWLLIFSPVFWEHYATYFIPFWGWVIIEARGVTYRRLIAVGVIALSWMPTPALLGLPLREPVNSLMLVSACMMFWLSTWRLFQRPLLKGLT